MATRESTPPPLIGKAGRYTVFMTPSDCSRSHTPSPKNAPPEVSRSYSSIPRTRTKMNPVHFPPVQPPPSVQAPPPPVQAPTPPPPVQVPPPQYSRSDGKSKGSGVYGFFWHAVARVQDAHSSLDAYLADWLGLNQSRYQWALDDYYENNTTGKEGGKPKEPVHKGQAV